MPCMHYAHIGHILYWLANLLEYNFGMRLLQFLTIYVAQMGNIHIEPIYINAFILEAFQC